ncbi:hypothetical protein [Edaphobacter sp. HDX4]|uniref:hypothetical protein n=1 Tax=Edaphobacter sp. HDX4 TaxID=2794064 RepID=UPI002FE53C6E
MQATALLPVGQKPSLEPLKRPTPMPIAMLDSITKRYQSIAALDGLSLPCTLVKWSPSSVQTVLVNSPQFA